VGLNPGVGLVYEDCGGPDSRLGIEGGHITSRLQDTCLVRTNACTGDNGKRAHQRNRLAGDVSRPNVVLILVFVLLLAFELRTGLLTLPGRDLAGRDAAGVAPLLLLGRRDRLATVFSSPAATSTLNGSKDPSLTASWPPPVATGPL